MESNSFYHNQWHWLHATLVASRYMLLKHYIIFRLKQESNKNTLVDKASKDFLYHWDFRNKVLSHGEIMRAMAQEEKSI